MESCSHISTIDIVTLVIASGGLVLGIVNYITELFRRKPHAKIRFANYLDSSGRIGLSVTVANTGESPFTISGIGIVLGRHKRLYPIHQWGGKFPKVLHAGETCETIIDRRCYTEKPGLDVKCVFARTPIGKEFYSKRLTKKFLGIE